MNLPYDSLLDTARQFNIEISPLQGDLVCAFVGEWNSGKSSLLNNLFGLPLLPERATPATKTLVLLQRNTDSAPHAKVQDDRGAIQEYQGTAAVEALQQSLQHLSRIEYQAPQLDVPAHTVFVDTPGFNDTDQQASTKAETVRADLIVFVLNARVSALNQTQIDFIQRAVLSKANLKDLFFVLTHSDVLEDDDDSASLRQRIGAHVGSDRIFLLSNKDAVTIQGFKQALYTYIDERRSVLLDERRQRHQRQLFDALRQQVALERVALQQMLNQTTEQRDALRTEIQEARRKESQKKSELRRRSQQRLQSVLQSLRELIEQTEQQLDDAIDSSSVEQLQKKGYLQQRIEDAMKTLEPQMQAKLDELMRSLQGDVQEGQTHSNQLLKELNLELDLPDYSSPLSRVSAEHIMPLAFMGSLLVFGWFSVPTLLVGFLALKAREFGLTRFGDQTGILDTVIDKIKDGAASVHRQTIKITLARTLSDYLNQVSDYFRDVMDKSTDQALHQINLVAELEKTLVALNNETSHIDWELRLDKAEALITNQQLANN
ncbi:dynamin family protein [Chromatium okenii]|nr:dynamin family protein [Chromatium okenii]